MFPLRPKYAVLAILLLLLFVMPPRLGTVNTLDECTSTINKQCPSLPSTTRSPSGWSDDILISALEPYQSEYPAIAVNGDYVHVAYYEPYGVWPDTTAEVRYVRSTDGGKTWSEPLNVSCVDGEYSDTPDIACSGNNVYIVWTDYRGPSRDIWINISHDGGVTWVGEKNLSAQDSRVSDWAHVCAWGDYVYVVWGDDRDHPGSGADSLYFRKSTDRGETWGPEKRLTFVTDLDIFYDDIPMDITTNGSTVHILFDRALNDTSRYESHYMKSEDYGETWSTPIMLTYKDNYNTYSGGIAVNGTNVHVVYENSTAEDEIYYRMSEDGGETWKPEVRLTNDPNQSRGPRVVAEGETVHVVFGDDRTGSYQLYYLNSTDNGNTWGSLTQLTTQGGGAKDFCRYNTYLHLVWENDRTGDWEVYYKRSPDFTTVVNTNLTLGWNFICLPGDPGTWTAKDWAEDIESKTNYLVGEVVRWKPSGWYSFVYRDSGDKSLVNNGAGINNFALRKNETYFVRLMNDGVLTDTTWECDLPQYNSANCPDWELNTGWNAVALPYNSTGAYMLTNSTHVLGNLSSHILTVADWNESTDSWLIDNGGTPFPLRWYGVMLSADANYNGLFVYSDKEVYIRVL